MRWIVCLLTAGIVAESPAFAQFTNEAATTKAESVLENLRVGKTADVVKELDSKLSQELPADRLQAVWPGLLKQFGAFKSIAERRVGLMDARQAVELFLVFEKETIVQRIVFDQEGRIAGLVYRPTSLAVLPANK